MSSTANLTPHEFCTSFFSEKRKFLTKKKKFKEALLFYSNSKEVCHIIPLKKWSFSKKNVFFSFVRNVTISVAFNGKFAFFDGEKKSKRENAPFPIFVRLASKSLKKTHALNA